MDRTESDKLPLPVPGDMVVAMRFMRGWVSDVEKGHGSYPELYIDEGKQGTVIQRCDVGNKVKLRIMIGARIFLVTHNVRNVALNWRII
jgi:hypothetical protein